jgi:hypothetical protein
MNPLRREVLLLVAVLLGLDAGFIAIYFLLHVRRASPTGKIVFTAVWTLAVLLLALRGLSRVRSARLRQPLE